MRLVVIGITCGLNYGFQKAPAAHEIRHDISLNVFPHGLERFDIPGP
jgi:hypothetical protein